VASTLTRLAFVAIACMATAAQAQAVTPPPLPPGSNLVRLDPGMSEVERKRHVRAHHHKMHHGKDMTRDDSVHGHEQAVAPAAPTGPAAGGSAMQGGTTARSGNAGVVQDGRGTGPGRQQTDKGASSWFYGQPEKK
jgi:hypothetical protein